MPDPQNFTIYVIRHGETEHNLERRLASHNDSPLTEQGRRQARANGRLLRKLAGTLDGFDFFASSLHRACTTMEVLREEIGLPPTGYRADHRLLEMHVGDHIGLRWDDIPEEHHLPFRTDPWNASRPGGESHADVYVRVGKLLGSLRRNSVLVTHGATALAIRANYLNLMPDDALRYQQPNAGILRLANGSEHFFSLDVKDTDLKSK